MHQIQRETILKRPTAVDGSFGPKAQLAINKNMMIQGLKLCSLVLDQRWVISRTVG